jgi:hypothetical protein
MRHLVHAGAQMAREDGAALLLQEVVGVIEAKVEWTDGRWERRDYPTIMDGWVVRYTIGYGSHNVIPEINASRNYVSATDIYAGSPEHLESAITIMRQAWQQHLHLAKSSKNRPLADPPVSTEQTEAPCI